MAGNGDRGFSGDGGPPLSAVVGLVGNLAVDGGGSLFMISGRGVRRVFVPDEPTPAGSSVSVQPIDTTAGASPVELTFDTVTSEGTTTLTTSSSGPAPPSGFQLGDPPTYYDVTTTASFSGLLTVCISYAGVSFTDESLLRLYHFEGGIWVDRTLSQDTVTDIICASVTSLSAFAVFEDVNFPPVADAGPDRTVECASPAGTAVGLDGSSSFDPDGDSISFAWAGPFPEGSGSATGASPTVTLSLGTSLITLTVSDGAVPSAADSVQVSVVVRAEGLESPLAALVPEGEPASLPDVAFRQGSTLPLRLRLFCGGTALSDADVSAPRIVALKRTGEAIDLQTVDIDSGQANDSGLLFRSSANGTWIYNLSTKGLSAGTHELVVLLPDGRRMAAGFVLRQ